MAEIGPSQPRKRNWWKLAFFVTLFAFEVAREIAVLATYSDAQVASAPSVTVMDDYAFAQGSWVRADGGSKLVKNAVSIRCDKNLNLCVEAQANSDERYFFPPYVDYFRATFAPDAVTYRNDQPTCVTYEVRIDKKLDRAFATRTKKPQLANDPNCKAVEPSVKMQLGDGYEAPDTKGHFVPVLDLLAAVFKLFD